MAATISPRPPSSALSTTSSTHQKAKSQFDSPDVTIDQVQEFIGRPHRSWSSAIKEQARRETMIQNARMKNDEKSETASTASGISAYSTRSTTTVRSTVSAPSRLIKGRMAMLPLRTTDNASEVKLSLEVRSVASEPRLKQNSSRAGSAGGSNGAARKPTFGVQPPAITPGKFSFSVSGVPVLPPQRRQ